MSVKNITDSTLVETCERMMRMQHSKNPDNRWEPSAVADCAHAILRDYRAEARSIERIVRDAIIYYEELYPRYPNDDCARELKKRAEIGNKWLNDHGFVEEKVVFDDEELTCC